MKRLAFLFLLSLLMASSLLAQEEGGHDHEKLESELQNLKQLLVKSAAKAQSAEAELQEIGDKLRILDEQLQIKNDTLEKSRKNLAALVQASLHLSQSPPEVMMLLQGDTDAMKIARALKMTSDGIRENMASIQAQTKELTRLQQKMALKRQELEQKQAGLNKERKQLAASLADRQILKEQLTTEEEQREAQKAKQLAQKAGNVQTLVTSLRREEGPNWTGHARRTPRPFTTAKGTLRLPMEGKLVKHFGRAEGQDGTSKGITVASRLPGAQVVAPFDGEVVFSGPFLEYGKMVILRHSDDFHTLLAGLADIGVSVGDFLLEGEPIGAMGSEKMENRLYVELRKDSQPINPEPWIKGLKKR